MWRINSSQKGDKTKHTSSTPPWSKNGKEFTLNQLLTHLKNIISKQRNCVISGKPPVALPKMKILPSWGGKTGTVSRIEQIYDSNTEKFETDGQNLRVERELADFGN